VKRDGGALLFAMLFPTLMAWWYFVALAPEGQSATNANPLLIGAYAAGKIIQFSFPLFWLCAVERQRLQLAAPSSRRIIPGLAFGAGVVTGMLGLYFGLLRHSTWLSATPAKIQAKIDGFGLHTPAEFILFAIFLSVVHSLLEEYYWRWFVFGRARRYLGFLPALVVSSVAFMGHHVVVLAVFFPGRFWELALPFSFTVGVGGGVFAWLYHRTESLYAPWLGHMLIDGAIMAVGYDMVFGLMGS
jgi:membrane protease YdiL (CAAX protease family)